MQYNKPVSFHINLQLLMIFIVTVTSCIGIVWLSQNLFIEASCIASVFGCALWYINRCINKTSNDIYSTILAAVADNSLSHNQQSNSKPLDVFQSLDILCKNALQNQKTQALIDNSVNMFMIIDLDFKITDASNRLKDLFFHFPEHLQSLNTQFDCKNLIGQFINSFSEFANNSHLHSYDQPYTKTIQIEQMIFDVKVTPYTDLSGIQIGYTLEWLDMTTRRTYQKEFLDLLSYLSCGDFSVRMTPEPKDPILDQISEKINSCINEIEKFISEITKSVQDLSNGITESYIPVFFQGQFAKTAHIYNEALGKVTNAMITLKNLSDVLSKSGQEITESSSNLVSCADQQAASLQQTSATMEEMATTIKLSSEHAEKASTMAISASRRANYGSKVAADAIASISTLQESSKRINDIVNVINSIAFQTNLLALNAAVEAARAGDSGKGFAVVASEVRVLAKRTADAASEIKDIISISEENVDDCVVHVTETNQALINIVSSIHSVETKIHEIATSSKQQSSAVAEISVTMSYIDTTTQKTAQLAETCASTSKDIRSHTNNLNQSLNFFKLNSDQVSPIKATLEGLKDEENRIMNEVLKKNNISKTSISQDDNQEFTSLLKQSNQTWQDF